MGFSIEDGTGSGEQAEVKNHKLLVSGIVSSPEHYANHNIGLGFNVIVTATPTGTGDYFFYMKNLNQDVALNIEGIWIKMESDDYIQIELNDNGTPIGGTDITPVNANTSSGQQALGTFLNSNDITGLNGGDVLHRIHHATSKGSIYHNFNMDIVLGTNGVLTLSIGAGAVPVECILVANYHGTNN